MIDNLTYTYNGNQMRKVEDATGNAAGFSNGANAANEYTYDNNGNLTKDSNKNISTIAYNSLNLPSKVTFTDGSTITYSYAADGTKLRTVHTINGTTTTKDYCSNVVYENGVQKMLLTEEGYVDLSASTPTYYYYLKDHQGNNRVVINSSGAVQETNHYYPFGGVFASTGNVQPYKYNGKELDIKKGLNWYDYGARHYDAALGRWFVVDPLTEKMYPWSPYVYCFNNPIKCVDEDGELPWLVAAIVGGAIDYVFQVAKNRIQGKSWSDSFGDIDVKSIATSAISSMAGVGLANVLGKTLAASNIAKASTSAGKMLNEISNVTIDAAMSATSQVVSGEELRGKNVFVDVITGKVLRNTGDELKTLIQNKTETGKHLYRVANRAQRLANENSRVSRKEQAIKATEAANSYGENSATIVTTIVETSKEKGFELYKENRKK